MNTTMRVITLLTALGAGVSGGVLFAFSSFVLPALRTLPTPQAVAAMNAINLAAPRSVFMLPLIGSAVGALVVGGYALITGPQPGRGWLIAGAVGSVATMVITALYHVPRNNALAAADPATAATIWPAWVAGWTALNHVRSATAILGAAALAIGARAGR